ncbi:MAG: hypothetical protein U0I22_06005 [Treponema sp.]|nr:hypothetical protein [Treponema sp.]
MKSLASQLLPVVSRLPLWYTQAMSSLFQFQSYSTDTPPQQVLKEVLATMSFAPFS